MAIKLGRPILVGGVGLSFLLWMLQSLHDSFVHLGEFTVFGAIALGAGFWLFQQKTDKSGFLSSVTSPLDRETVEKAIAQAENVINQLEAENHAVKAGLRDRVPQLAAELDRQDLRLAVTGGKAVGKTTLIKVLSSWGQQQQKISLKETPALFVGGEAGLEAENSAKELAIASDLVLFLTTGDLTDPEFETIKQLVAANQRLILTLNKQDQYLPEERVTVLQQLRQRLQGVLKQEDVVAIASSPNPIKVRQHRSDGAVQEWMETPNPEITTLTQIVSKILDRESQQLVWATTWRAAVALKAEAKTALNEVRRNRAIPVIERYQWIAAAAAFANPVPALDLLATAAINAQMVVDLGAIYQQKFSLQQAQTVAGTMGSLMLKLGLVELSIQTIGGVLKSNAITFVAGGAVQGVSAAYLTRLAGMSLIQYFQAQDVSTTSESGTSLNLDKLGQTLQNVFQQNQRAAFLQSFVKQALGHILPRAQTVAIAASETAAI